MLGNSRSRSCAGIAVALLVVLAAAAVVVVEGRLEDFSFDGKGKSGYDYLSKFCFLNGNQGTFQYTAEFKNASAVEDVKLLAFSDNEWRRVRSMSCAERMAGAYHSFDLATEPSGSFLTNVAEHSRYMYFEITSCSTGFIPAMNLHLNFTNPGGIFRHQFSADDFGIFQTYIGTTSILAVTLIFYIIALIGFKATRMIHLVVKIFSVVIFAQFTANILQVIHYSIFASDGVGVPILEGISDIMEIIGYLMFMILLFCMARGVAISDVSSPFSGRERAFFLFAMLVVSTAYFSTIVVSVEDTPELLYLYQHIPTILMCVAQILMFVWFWICVRSSLSRETNPSKRTVYRFIQLFYTLWFLLPPMVVFFSPLLSSWTRNAAIDITSNVAQVVAIAVMVSLLWPSQSAKFLTLSTATDASNRYGGLRYDEL